MGIMEWLGLQKPKPLKSFYTQALLRLIETTIVRLAHKDQNEQRYNNPELWCERVHKALGPEAYHALYHRKEQMLQVIQYYNAAWILAERLCMDYAEDVQHNRLLEHNNMVTNFKKYLERLFK